MFAIPSVTVLQLIGLIIAIGAFGAFVQWTTGAAHKGIVVVSSILVIVAISPISALVLVIYAHLGWFMLSKGTRQNTMRTAWLLIGALMLTKVGAAACGLDHSEEGASTVHFYFIIGLSYYTFRIASTLFDKARGALKAESYMDFMVYCFFAPIFVGGPVERYRAFGRNQAGIADNLVHGFYRLARAIIKKVLFADIIVMFGVMWFQSQISGDARFSLSNNGLTWAVDVQLPFWANVLGFGFLSILRAYFDLSAFTDIAIGGGRLLGYNVSENFNRPFMARNIIDFWRRWHLTIAGWAKDYIFSPLMLGTRRLAFSAFLTMIAMGMWHEISARWLFWGACHGLGLLVVGAWQRTAASRSLKRLEAGLAGNNNHLSSSFSTRSMMAQMRGALVAFIFATPAWLITFGYMSLVFVAVSLSDFGEALEVYKRLFTEPFQN